jgi:hypothetical protein
VLLGVGQAARVQGRKEIAMRRATILLAAMMAAGTTGVTMTGPAAEAKRPSQNQSQDPSSLIKKGMTLEEAQQATGVAATPVGGPNNGVQTYRIMYRQNSGGGANDHPTISFYMFGVKDDKVTWVHKS